MAENEENGIRIQVKTLSRSNPRIRSVHAFKILQDASYKTVYYKSALFAEGSRQYLFPSHFSFVFFTLLSLRECSIFYTRYINTQNNDKNE